MFSYKTRDIEVWYVEVSLRWETGRTRHQTQAYRLFRNLLIVVTSMSFMPPEGGGEIKIGSSSLSLSFRKLKESGL